mmetsp:Transcript_11630/g.42532  ORF Transcript_11630/g.42532 Transcript_11630/m.42532 type:complete len:539 (+) Transcript_11630:217-1833(+)
MPLASAGISGVQSPAVSWQRLPDVATFVRRGRRRGVSGRQSTKLLGDRIVCVLRVGAEACQSRRLRRTSRNIGFAEGEDADLIPGKDAGQPSGVRVASKAIAIVAAATCLAHATTSLAAEGNLASAEVAARAMSTTSDNVVAKELAAWVKTLPEDEIAVLLERLIQSGEQCSPAVAASPSSSVPADQRAPVTIESASSQRAGETPTSVGVLSDGSLDPPVLDREEGPDSIEPAEVVTASSESRADPEKLPSTPVESVAQEGNMGDPRTSTSQDKDPRQSFLGGMLKDSLPEQRSRFASLVLIGSGVCIFAAYAIATGLKDLASRVKPPVGGRPASSGRPPEASRSLPAQSSEMPGLLDRLRGRIAMRLVKGQLQEQTNRHGVTSFDRIPGAEGTTQTGGQVREVSVSYAEERPAAPRHRSPTVQVPYNSSVQRSPESTTGADGVLWTRRKRTSVADVPRVSSPDGVCRPDRHSNSMSGGRQVRASASIVEAEADALAPTGLRSRRARTTARLERLLKEAGVYEPCQMSNLEHLVLSRR